MIIKVTSVEWTWLGLVWPRSFFFWSNVERENVHFALVDEMEKNKMQEEVDELGALISNLRLGDDEMSIETYIQMEGEEIIELELSTDELVDAALGVNRAQGFDLNVDLHSVDVDDVAPPTIKLSDAKHHASLLSNFLLDNSHFGVDEILSFQKASREFR